MSGIPGAPQETGVGARSSEIVSPSPKDESHRTRTSSAWVGIAFGLICLVAVMVFVMQNLNSVEVTFLSLRGELPLAVLVLLAGTLGAMIVFAFGTARIAQLRIQARRARKRAQGAGSGSAGSISEVID